MLTSNELSQLIDLLLKETRKESENKKDIKATITNKRLLHYTKEILRFWNRLGYLEHHSLKKNLIPNYRRFFNGNNTKNIKYYSALMRYFIYRIHFEKASIKQIQVECQEISKKKRINNGDKNKKNSKITKCLTKNQIRKLIEEIGSSNYNKNIPQINENLSISTSVPSFTIKQLKKVMTLEDIKKNLNVMNGYDEEGKNPIDIGFWACVFNNNLAKEEYDFLKKKFEKWNAIKENMSYFIDERFGIEKLFFDLWRIPDKFKSSFIYLISNYQEYSTNIFIIEKASLLISLFLNLKKEENYLEIAAAPGMKSVIIYKTFLEKEREKEREKGNNSFLNSIQNFLQKKFVKMVLGDLSSIRLSNMKSFLIKVFGQKASKENFELILHDGWSLPYKNRCFNKILLDAPCTGSGTFWPHPELKIRQNPKFLENSVDIQRQMLNEAFRVLKPNGLLLYSTCSLYPHEGEWQIQEFLIKNKDAELVRLPSWCPPPYKTISPKITEINSNDIISERKRNYFSNSLNPYNSYINLNDKNKYMCRFLPSRDSTIGFFFVIIKKKIRL